MQDKYSDKAAQLWCLPQHAHKEMDVDFAMSIAQVLREVAEEAVDITVRMFHGSWKGRISPDDLDALKRVLAGCGSREDIDLLKSFGIDNG